MSSSWQDVEADGRGLIREVNESIACLGATFEQEGRLPFVCECGNHECMQSIELELSEYESVRAHPRRYVIALNHENPDVEIVGSQNQYFAIVETFVGEASRIPEATDPRGLLSA